MTCETRPYIRKVLEYAFFGIIFCLPFSKSLAEIFVALAIFLALFLKITEGKDIRFVKSGIETAFLLYIGINFLSIFWSAVPYLSAKALITKIIKYILLFYAIYEYVDDGKTLKRILTVITASVFLITVNGFIQVFTYGYDVLHMYKVFGRDFGAIGGCLGFATSSFPYPNDYSAWLIVLTPIFVSISFIGFKNISLFIKTVSYLATTFLVYSLYLAKTRGAWLALFVGFLAMGLIKAKRLIILFLAIFILLYVFSPPTIKCALKSTLGFNDRIEMWTNSIKMIKDKPITGFGLNTYYETYKKYRTDKYRNQRGSYAHNCYLQSAAEIGIPGLIIFLYLLLTIFKNSFSRIKNIKSDFYLNFSLGAWVGLFNFSLYAFIDTNFYSLPLVTLFWFMAGLLFAVIKIYEKKAA